jgi:hypothetical protein
VEAVTSLLTSYGCAVAQALLVNRDVTRVRKWPVRSGSGRLTGDASRAR